MKGQVGLKNLGLTCYANAVLQCLRNVDRLPWIFSDGRYDTLFKKDAKQKRLLKQEVAKSFAEVLKMQEEGSRPSVLKPAGLFIAVRTCVKDSCYDQFIQTAPHDAHEFLMFMLETLHESVSISVEMQIMKSAPKTEEEKRVIRALEAWKDEFSKEYSPLVDLFYGLLHVQTKCLTCNTISHRWETFNTLKAVVPTTASADAVDVLSMLAKDLKGEDIEGYSCDKCSPVRTTAHRESSIWRLPRTLILCLKRFTYDGRKIHTRVTAPLDLDLKTHFSEESPEKSATTEYGIRSIVDHQGGAGGGHYTAQCKDKHTSQWLVYDDESVHPIAAPMFGESTYVLFYERGSS